MTSSKAASSGNSSISGGSNASSAAEPVKQIKTIPGGKMLTVQNIQQTPELAAGCEVTAASIILNYTGFPVSKCGLLKYLPQNNTFTTKGGVKYGPNPWTTFVGKPDTDRYGCYAPVIVKTINSYLSQLGNKKGDHMAADISGAPIESLYENIDNGTPVIVWVTIGMQEPVLSDSWFLSDTNQSFQWIQKEHCMVLIGYDSTKAYFCDPLSKDNVVSYNKDLFEERYREMFMQSVAMN